MHHLCIRTGPGGTRMYLGGAISAKADGWGDVGKVKNRIFESNDLDQRLKVYHIASKQADI